METEQDETEQVFAQLGINGVWSDVSRGSSHSLWDQLTDKCGDGQYVLTMTAVTVGEKMYLIESTNQLSPEQLQTMRGILQKAQDAGEDQFDG